MTHRIESAQSAITVREGTPPDGSARLLFGSMEDVEGGVGDLEVESMLQSARQTLLAYAELSGEFSTMTATMWVDHERGSIAVAFDEHPPPLNVVVTYFSAMRWQPFAYMIPAFLGALIGLGGLFWMAARWQLAASDRHREIDETRS